jgi:hypothetical protein
MPTQYEYDEVETENIILAKDKKALRDAAKAAMDYMNDHVGDDGGLSEGDRIEAVTILHGVLDRVT